MAMPDLKSTCKHESYFILGADLFLLVEHVHFCVHRYFFERESVYFRTLLETPLSPDGQPPAGSAVSNAVILDQVTADEFAQFLWVFYNPRFSLYDEATVEDWSSILRLSYRWVFPEVKALAVRELQKTDLSPVNRIALYQANDVDRNLLIPAYAALCEREEPLTLDEGLVLGMETTLTIARGREEVRAQRSADGVKSPLKPTLHGSELYAVVKDLFNISSSSSNDTNPIGSPTIPKTPKATGSDINGHATSTDKETNGQKSGGLAAPPIPTPKQKKPNRERKKTEETQQQQQKKTPRKTTDGKNAANNGESGLPTPVAGRQEAGVAGAGTGGLEEETRNGGNEEKEKLEMNEGAKPKVEGEGTTVGGAGSEGDPKLDSDSKLKSTNGGSENANAGTNTNTNTETTTTTTTSTTPVQTNPVGTDVKTEHPQPQAVAGGGVNGTTGIEGSLWDFPGF